MKTREKYTNDLYAKTNWTDEVLTFLRYNANKALMNLGQETAFPDTADDVNPIVMNGFQRLPPTMTSSHKLVMVTGWVKVEAMQDDDYQFSTEDEDHDK